MQDNDISVVRGDTFYFGVEFTGLNADVSALTFTVRVLPTDEAPIFQKSLGDGISLVKSETDAETGKKNATYAIRVSPEDTKDLDFGAYYYDLEFRQKNQVFSDTYTLLRGRFVVEYEITGYNEAKVQ